MKTKKLIGWVIGIPVLVVLLILIIVYNEPEKGGISRAMAAKSVALAFQDPQGLKGWQKEYGASHYEANALQEWYVPYMDYLYEEGYWLEEDTPADEKTALGQLTYGEAYYIASEISDNLASLIKATKQNSEKPYPEELWWLFYDSLLKEADTEGRVEKSSVFIYGTPDNIENTPAWTAYTNLGTVGFVGLALDTYIDHELIAYVRGEELITVLEDKGDTVTYRNVWLLSTDKAGVSAYVGDIEREFPFKKSLKKEQEITGHLADIQLEKGKITRVSLKKERVQGKILSVQESGVEIEGYGLVPYDSEFKVLKTYGEVERQKLKDILVGYDLQEFVVAEGKLCAALTVRSFDAETIRVLLMNQGFKELYHETVTFSSAGSIKLIHQEQETTIPAGEPFTVAVGDKRLQEGRMILEPQNGYEITISSLERTHGQPSYEGRLEVLEGEEGLVVINDLYLEDYLKKVVPSEMPSSYEKEALKAQAVCARTYAYMQIQSNTYSQYGAHVDDSTNFQVYNNVESDNNTAAAIRETYGKLLLYEGNPIQAYYFSTSCGVTADASVWGSDPEKTPYLKSGALKQGKKTLDLVSNSAFSSFIKDKTVSSYDASYPFFRWNATTNTSILSQNIDGVGTVTDISITERGAGGVAMKLQVTGTEGEKTISGQNKIRAALGDKSMTITRGDDKTVDGWSSLPSGFLSIEKVGETEDGVQNFQIYGGGYGHGVGMSQNGAQGMAKSGMGYVDILQFFYTGVTVGEKDAS